MKIKSDKNDMSFEEYWENEKSKTLLEKKITESFTRTRNKLRIFGHKSKIGIAILYFILMIFTIAMYFFFLARGVNVKALWGITLIFAFVSGVHLFTYIRNQMKQYSKPENKDKVIKDTELDSLTEEEYDDEEEDTDEEEIEIDNDKIY